MTTETRRPPPREVEIAHPGYQPSKPEFVEDAHVEASFEEAVEALCQPITIRCVNRPKPRQ